MVIVTLMVIVIVMVMVTLMVIVMVTVMVTLMVIVIVTVMVIMMVTLMVTITKVSTHVIAAQSHRVRFDRGVARRQASTLAGLAEAEEGHPATSAYLRARRSAKD